MKIFLTVFLLIFSSSFVFAESEIDDICGRSAPEEGLSLIKAMNNLDKVLVQSYKADKVFYMCPNDSTWSLVRGNNFPEIILINTAFILFDKETETHFFFKILSTDEDYEHANYAEINKVSGAIEVLNL